MHEIARTHAERASFLTIYIREAHPTDEWQMRSNEKEGVCYPQPRTLEERVAIARDFVARHGYELPLAIDDVTDVAEQLYAGWPERLYIIGTDGKVAYKGKPGPFGFEPDEVDEWLARPASVTPGLREE